MKDRSPFTPGNPVPVELFVGRRKEISEIQKHIRQSTCGKQESIFLSGERGIGKSSFAKFLSGMACKEQLLPVHIFLGEVTSLDEMARRTFEEILISSQSQTWFSKISGYFKDKIQQIDVFGVAISFKPSESDLRELVQHFPDVLYNITERIKPDKKGLFIVLDDIDMISKAPEFANWFKSLVDRVATRYSNYPICIMLIGLPEFRDNLSRNQPSLTRIFRVVDIEKLERDEVIDFFTRAFEKAGIKVEETAMDTMVKYSSGLPTIMHEIGDAVYWIDNDNIVKIDDVLDGIITAAENIGKKYLDPTVYRAVRSEKYKSILGKLGMIAGAEFKKKDIEDQLSPEEKKVFDNFLRKMRELKVIMIDKDCERGSYRFVNEIYPVYFLMKSD